MQAKELINATCPDCRGPLSEYRENGLREYRCLVGHAYSAHSLLQAHADAQEKALWAAVVALEEAMNLVRMVSPQLPAAVAKRLEEQAATKLQQAAEVRKVIEALEPFETE